MKKKVIIIVFIIFVVGVGLLVYSGQRNSRQKDLFYSGTIEATQANLSFQVPGRVVKIYVQEGQTVAKETMIAELDRVEFEARHAQAQANLDRAQKAKSQLETVLGIYKKTLPAEVARAQANVRSAVDTLRDAEKNYRRFEELYKKGVVTEKERDALRLHYDVAGSRLTESESLLKLAQGNLAKIDAARQDVEAAVAQIDAARAVLQQAAIQLDYTRLKSPRNGVVSSRNIEPGETVTPGREVITIADLDRVDLKIFVEETEIGKVRPQQPVDVQVDTFPDKTYRGNVSFISPEGEFTPK
ncbi:MAG TPA: efflux RND transporter periplasmic adaptor subunit, partial [Smithellaceae bacterium]|nr:efflux RND transporter periplasmic adaptor subunit [Smithellaceae bacterium]